MNSGDKFNSPYYPRRARWYGFIFSLGTTIRHRTALDRIRLPKEITLGRLLGSFFIPGLAVYLRGQRLWGKAALAACAVLFLCFIVRLGHSSGNYAFGLMLSIHASGFVYYCSPVLLGKDFAARIAFTIAMLIGLGLFVYLPLRGTIQKYLLLPVRNGNQVIIVSVQRAPVSLNSGEWAAFATEKGIIFGKIVGLGGDVVGSTTMPENHWLIHAQFVRKYYHGGLFPTFAYDGGIIEQDVIVSREEFIGKPFNRWFGHKQILP